MLPRDPLMLAADLLDLARGPEAQAAREVVSRAAAHVRGCSACRSSSTNDLLPDLDAVLAAVVDAEIDAAAVELALELELTGLCGVDFRALK